MQAVGQKICNFCLHSGESSGRDDPHTTILDQSDNFYVVPSKGSLVAGYILIVSKQHLLSVGTLTPELLDELILLKNKTKEKLSRIFPESVVVFEHGPYTQGTTTGCGVDHLHIHLAPLDQKIVTALHDKFDFKKVNMTDLSDAVQRNMSYLYVESEGQWVAIEAHEFPSQSIRRVIAQELGHDNYDRKIYPNTEISMQTVALRNA